MQGVPLNGRSLKGGHRHPKEDVKITGSWVLNGHPVDSFLEIVMYKCVACMHACLSVSLSLCIHVATFGRDVGVKP